LCVARGKGSGWFPTAVPPSLEVKQNGKVSTAGRGFVVSKGWSCLERRCPAAEPVMAAALLNMAAPSFFSGRTCEAPRASRHNSGRRARLLKNAPAVCGGVARPTQQKKKTLENSKPGLCGRRSTRIRTVCFFFECLGFMPFFFTITTTGGRLGFVGKINHRRKLERAIGRSIFTPPSAKF